MCGRALPYRQIVWFPGLRPGGHSPQARGAPRKVTDLPHIRGQALVGHESLSFDDKMNHVAHLLNWQISETCPTLVVET